VIDAYKEVIWMKNLLQELDMKQVKYNLFRDSQSAIHLAKNLSCHSRTKHIDVIYHWISWCCKFQVGATWQDPYWQEWLKHSDQDITKWEATCVLQDNVHGGAPHMSHMGENVEYPPHVSYEMTL
jgi:hypothetical protein